MSFGETGVLSYLMENCVNEDNVSDFWPKEKKMQTQRYIYARRDTEDGPLEIIPPQEMLWYCF